MKLTLGILGIVIILVVAVLLVSRRPSGTPAALNDASLLLIGFTNIPSKGRHATFCLTNNTTKHIAFIPDSREQMVAGAWQRTPLSGRARRAVRDWIGLREELSSHEAFTFYVQTPTNSGTWRLVFMCQEREPVKDGVRDVYQHVTDTNAAALQSRVFSGRQYFLRSPEVTE
jgi:hypothetical protein